MHSDFETLFNVSSCQIIILVRNNENKGGQFDRGKAHRQ